MLTGDFEGDPVLPPGVGEALKEMEERTRAAEEMATALLGVVAEIVASMDARYPKTQAGWAARLLPLLSKHGVSIDANLRQVLERLRP